MLCVEFLSFFFFLHQTLTSQNKQIVESTVVANNPSFTVQVLSVVFNLLHSQIYRSIGVSVQYITHVWSAAIRHFPVSPSAWSLALEQGQNLYCSSRASSRSRDAGCDGTQPFQCAWTPWVSLSPSIGDLGMGHPLATLSSVPLLSLCSSTVIVFSFPTSLLEQASHCWTTTYLHRRGETASWQLRTQQMLNFYFNFCFLA